MSKIAKATLAARKAIHSTKAQAVAVGTGLTVLGTQVMAAVDVTAVGTSLSASQTSAEGVGSLVIGVAAALVVIGLIIGIVKKV